MRLNCLLGNESRSCWANKKCTMRGAEETGRLHFFYHSPSSTFPVRDVEGKQGAGQKTEPYIEKDAENYCVRCYQGNIRAFLRSAEKYLFLRTTCKSEDLPRQYDKKFIVGYIVKAKCIRRPRQQGKERVAAQGATRLYSFRDAYPLGRLRRERNFRHMRKELNTAQTGRVLAHFSGRSNIRQACLRGLRRLKRSLRRGNIDACSTPTCRHRHCQ
jgi:hypothetical protein